VTTETVYSDRCEAGVVMTSLGSDPLGCATCIPKRAAARIAVAEFPLHQQLQADRHRSSWIGTKKSGYRPGATCPSGTSPLMAQCRFGRLLLHAGAACNRRTSRSSALRHRRAGIESAPALRPPCDTSGRRLFRTTASTRSDLEARTSSCLLASSWRRILVCSSGSAASDSQSPAGVINR